MRKLYEVNHDDDDYVYSAESAYEARRFHDELIVTPSLNHEPAMSALPHMAEFHEVPLDREITVRDAGPNGETVTHTAHEWACEISGLISTTAGY